MSGVRIKDLQSAKSVIEQGFDQFEFVVDSPDPDATLNVSDAELKKAIGTEKAYSSVGGGGRSTWRIGEEIRQGRRYNHGKYTSGWQCQNEEPQHR